MKKPEQTFDDLSVTIGRRLQSVRKRRGLTQKELAEKIGMTREVITSYETGRVHITVTTLLNVAAVLRVSVYEILGVERKAPEIIITRRWAKRIDVIEGLPEYIQKHILRTLDDVIKANTRLSIFEN